LKLFEKREKERQVLKEAKMKAEEERLLRE
jgi:hypothetical protein